MAYFIPTDEGLQPVPEARSPWSADMLHGRLLAGLAARAAEPHPKVTVWSADEWDVPGPDDLEPPPEMAGSGWQIRMISEGGFWSTARKQL